MDVVLNGRTLSLSGIFPLRMKDLKALARLGILRPGEEKDTYNLDGSMAYVLYVLQKVDASVQAEEIDNLLPGEFGAIQAQISQAQQAAEPVPPFSSTSSTSSPGPTDGL